MTDAELQAIRERCDRATSGPWDITVLWSSVGGRLREQPECQVHQSLVEYEIPRNIACRRFTGQSADFGSDEPPRDEGEVGLRPEDAAFIAHARADVPALLAEVDRLREMLRSVCPHYRQRVGTTRDTLPPTTPWTCPDCGLSGEWVGRMP